MPCQESIDTLKKWRAECKTINSPPRGPSTYLHAGSGTKGWPHDHKAEDAFDLPPAYTTEGDIEYFAKFGPKGEALLLKSVTTHAHTRIAAFDTMADARTAAEALNNHKGY